MKAPLQVLIVEDNRDDAQLVLHALRQAGFDPKHRQVQTESEFLAQLKNPTDLILSDFSMPRFNGLRALELRNEQAPDVPFILISGTLGEEQAVEAMKRGATDYLLKDRIARLGLAVERALEQKRLGQERKRMQEQLRLQSTAVATTGNAVLVTDRAGTILWVNPAFTTLTGYTSEDAVGKTPRILKSGKQDTAFYRDLWKTILSGKTWRGEFINRRKDESIFYDEHAVTPVRSENGDITHFVGVMHDVTERKRAEDVLKESERRFRELLENVELIAMTLDKNGVVTFCNDYLLRLTGWKREEVIGNSWFENFIPDTHASVRKLFFDTIDAGGLPLHYENPIKTMSGDIREIRWNNTMLRDEADRIIGTASIGEDITERKRAEESLRESEQKFRQLAENINEVFWITDPTKHQMVYVSPAYEDVWGRSCESLYAEPQSWLDAVHPDDRQRVLEAATTEQAKGTYQEIYRIVRPDNSIRWISDSAFPVLNSAGEVERIVGLATDITEKRKLEEQFRQSQKMEAIGQLAGGVAHDFNNILGVIQMQVGLLKMDDNLSATQTDLLNDVSKAVQRAANLTRQLLLFSRRQVMQPRNWDLNEVIANITKMLRRIVGEDIRTQIKYAPNALWVHADAGMLDQVLMNLTVNSRDAMPKGGSLLIETAAVDLDEFAASQTPRARPGSFVRLSVTDTGGGIPEEILSHIFEPFFTTKEPGKGTGLGLATVFGIVEQHQGWINVYSEGGLGTTFRIYLPRQTDENTKQVEESKELLPCAGNETILLVEDELQLRYPVQRALAQLGYRVLEAATGKEAVEIWKRHRSEIQLLLTDMVMPGGMNGRELAEQLQKESPKLKVIYASGYSIEVAGSDLQLDEGVNFLPKPFDFHQLAQTVRARLDS